MKGKSLTALAQELEHIRATAEDVMVSPRAMMMDMKGKIEIANGRKVHAIVNPTNWAHQQIASYTDIPKAYYDRMLENDKPLLSANVNHWLHGKEDDDRRLLRTVDGNLRGFLSSRYRVIDSYDLLNVVLPILKTKGFQVVSSELTEKRLYIKAALPKLSAIVKPGDVVNFGVVITNSEVGAGMFRIEPYALRLVCSNGLISDAAIKKFHVGKDNGTEEMMSVLSDEALRATDEALMLQVRDVLIASTDPAGLFQKQIEAMRESTTRKITNFDLVEVVKKAASEVGITSKMVRENILAQLATGNEGAGLTQWGLVNSFTAAAKIETISYDDSVDLERAGGKILTLSPSEWNKIAA